MVVAGAAVAVSLALSPGQPQAASTDEQISSKITRGSHALVRLRGSRRADGDFDTVTFIPRVPCGGGRYRFGLARTYVPTNTTTRVTYRLRASKAVVTGHRQRCGRALTSGFGQRRVSILLRRTREPHTWLKLTGRRVSPNRFSLRLRIRRLLCMGNYRLTVMVSAPRRPLRIKYRVRLSDLRVNGKRQGCG